MSILHYIAAFIVISVYSSTAFPKPVIVILEVIEGADVKQLRQAFDNKKNSDVHKNTETSKTRVKRDDKNENKFITASKMSQMKLLQLHLQMVRNFITGNDIGGIHPLAHNVPKAVVILFKERITDILFPEVGETKKTD